MKARAPPARPPGSSSAIPTRLAIPSPLARDSVGAPGTERAEPAQDRCMRGRPAAFRPRHCLTTARAEPCPNCDGIRGVRCEERNDEPTKIVKPDAKSGSPARARPAAEGWPSPRLRALLVQASLEEAEEALGHEDDHGREDETHGDEVVLGEEAGEALAQEEEEGGPRDGTDEGADAT